MCLIDFTTPLIGTNDIGAISDCHKTLVKIIPNLMNIFKGQF